MCQYMCFEIYNTYSCMSFIVFLQSLSSKIQCNYISSSCLTLKILITWLFHTGLAYQLFVWKAFEATRKAESYHQRETLQISPLQISPLVFKFKTFLLTISLSFQIDCRWGQFLKKNLPSRPFFQKRREGEVIFRIFYLPIFKKKNC